MNCQLSNLNQSLWISSIGLFTKKKNICSLLKLNVVLHWFFGNSFYLFIILVLVPGFFLSYLTIFLVKYFNLDIKHSKNHTIYF